MQWSCNTWKLQRRYNGAATGQSNREEDVVLQQVETSKMTGHSGVAAGGSSRKEEVVLQQVEATKKI